MKILIVLLMLAATSARAVEASYYGQECAGKLMANGRPFNPQRLTCASWNYPIGTRLMVTSGRRHVVVRVTDRGPAMRLVQRGRTIDLSEAAMRRLTRHPGLLQVSIRKAPCKKR